LSLTQKVSPQQLRYGLRSVASNAKLLLTIFFSDFSGLQYPIKFEVAGIAISNFEECVSRLIHSEVLGLSVIREATLVILSLEGEVGACVYDLKFSIFFVGVVFEHPEEAEEFTCRLAMLSAYHVNFVPLLHFVRLEFFPEFEAVALAFNRVEHLLIENYFLERRRFIVLMATPNHD